ncbi:short-chain dehydrogenase (plasmid) [Burkholderia sp. PAMC 28687]|uniref:3-oxoacyl-[acyl-carrier protein] reductase n=1 Tax=Caballeronia sordidicola TaxID=196367 RepID=A0A242M5F1_CABSO|nr:MULTISPECIES: glucose 1-dehydrogenase [Burkholderiaceae]AMM18472.1 short-chain dehydrogenase [Burkholderia sp. PAMC 28687]OTP66418.1 3-oxoacyl-[acyl-carrier protein] reductase [Caballeronia sordidicola]
MSKLSGKVALVTGSSKGIGAGVALRLAADGAAVVVNYSRSAEDAQIVVDKIVGAGGKAVAVKANIATPADIQPLIDAALHAFGRLDILVNNAGVYKIDSLDTLSAETFDEHFHLNVRGLLLTTQAAARVLPAGGVIVNISSGLAKSPYPMVHVYCATKGAVDTLTRTLGIELGPRKIRVVGIAPGFVATEGNAESSKDMAAFLVSKTPLGRVGQPGDIAAAVSYVVSDDAGWITGCTIDVAGGMVF